MLRDSFRNVLKDAELLAEAKKSRMDVEYTAGEELEALVKEVLNQPPEVIEQARKILAIKVHGRKIDADNATNANGIGF